MTAMEVANLQGRQLAAASACIEGETDHQSGLLDLEEARRVAVCLSHLKPNIANWPALSSPKAPGVHEIREAQAGGRRSDCSRRAGDPSGLPGRRSAASLRHPNGNEPRGVAR